MLGFLSNEERMSPKQDIRADYDPKKARQGVDHEALKKDIHSQRQQDSHGQPA
jgi:hypothetical protein